MIFFLGVPWDPLKINRRSRQNRRQPLYPPLVVSCVAVCILLASNCYNKINYEHHHHYTHSSTCTDYLKVPHRPAEYIGTNAFVGLLYG